MSEFVLWLRVVVDPRYWIRNAWTNRVWDNSLRQALGANPSIRIVDQFEVEINGVGVWIKNYPYEYGYPIGVSGRSLLPSRRTARILRDMIPVDEKDNREREIETVCGQVIRDWPSTSTSNGQSNGYLSKARRPKSTVRIDNAVDS